jgi:hypothetical protein
LLDTAAFRLKAEEKIEAVASGFSRKAVAVANLWIAYAASA